MSSPGRKNSGSLSRNDAAGRAVSHGAARPESTYRCGMGFEEDAAYDAELRRELRRIREALTGGEGALALVLVDSLIASVGSDLRRRASSF